jgi:hypothetical protein
MRKWLFVLVMLLAGGLVPAPYHYCYEFSPCDSIMFIKEFNGVADTVVHVSDSIFDTTIAEAQFDSLGSYFMFLRLKYEDETNWVRGFDVYQNTYAASGTGTVISIVATTDTFTTTVYGRVVDLHGNGIEDALARFELKETGVFREYDSSLVFNTTYEDRTDTIGLWQVDVPASNRLFRSNATTDTLFYDVTFTYGHKSKTFSHIFVPDTTQITFQTVRF